MRDSPETIQLAKLARRQHGRGYTVRDFSRIAACRDKERHDVEPKEWLRRENGLSSAADLRRTQYAQKKPNETI